MKQPKIVYCCALDTGWRVAKHLLERGIHISCFVSIANEKAIEQKVAGYRSVEDLAKQYNVPVYYARKYNLKSEEDIAFFRQHRFDIMLQAWQRLIPEDILETLNIGAVGIHGSSEFLPRGRGRSPINWSLIEGKRRFILHFFLIKPGIDDGDVFHYEMFDINEWDDCYTLYLKNYLVTSKVIEQFIPRLMTGDIKLIQQVGEPTYYPKRSDEDGLIDWTKAVWEIHNFIRALTRPYPGAFSYIKGKKIKIWKAQPFDTRIDFPDAFCGEVIEVVSDTKIIVKCCGGLLLITDYDFEGDIVKNVVLTV